MVRAWISLIMGALSCARALQWGAAPVVSAPPSTTPHVACTPRVMAAPRLSLTQKEHAKGRKKQRREEASALGRRGVGELLRR